MPASPLARPSGWMLSLLACAQLIIALDATIVFVALPDIGDRLGFSAQQLQWVVSAYSVAFGGFLLLGGRAADLLGKRRFYIVGQSLYALASLAGACALLARRWIPADPVRQRGRQFDLRGALTVTLGGTLLVFSIVQGPEWGWTAAATLACLALSLGLLWLFVRLEQRSPDPLMPLRLLAYPQLRMAMLITALFMSSFGVQYYFLSLYFQQIYQFSVLQSGLAFLPSTLLCTLGIWMAERALLRVGLRATLVGGLLAGALGIGLVYLALPGSGGYLGLLPGIVILSVGQGMTWNTMWISAGQGIAVSEQGVAAGVASTSQQIGGALGLALLVSLANTLGSAGHAAYGIEMATAASALLALLGALLALRLPRVPALLTKDSVTQG